MTEPNTRPRYSHTPLPPYSYVPGFAPHPVSDPRGHMHGQPHSAAARLNPSQWQESETYRWGVDLFNHGFYWEAHEAWESLWHAAGRQGTVAAWLKSLIKLAAAAVKLREGNAAGAERHARRSLELLNEVREQLTADQHAYAGVELSRVGHMAQEILVRSGTLSGAEPDLLLNRLIELAADC